MGIGKLKNFILACLGVLAWQSVALAQDTEATGDTPSQPGLEWLGISGRADLEAVFVRPEAGEGTEGTGIAEATLGFAVGFNDWIAGEIGLIYEHTGLGEPQRVPGSEASDVETATLTFGPAGGPWSFTAGRQFPYFGVFDTHMVSDPLTLELGETNEIALQMQWTAGGIQIAAFGFQGDDGQDAVDGVAGFGAAISYSTTRNETEIALNLAYTSDIGYADNILGALSDATGGQGSAHRNAGVSAYAALRYGWAAFIGEYLAAMDAYQVNEMAFSGRGAKPSSWLIEAAYDFALGNRNATAAIGYQGTREALAIELPARRLLAAVSLELAEPFALSIEWARETDYALRHGGGGERATAVTIQLSWIF